MKTSLCEVILPLILTCPALGAAQHSTVWVPTLLFHIQVAWIGDVLVLITEGKISSDGDMRSPIGAFSKHRHSGPMLKSICPYVCLSVCVSVCLFTFEVPFNGLFAPISQSRMSNIFRDSESLGKSNGKKWSHI